MKTRIASTSPRGVTLIEMTVVIMLILALAGGTLMYFGGTDKWKKGKEASEKLRTVYAAQRAYLADNPTTAVSSLTSDKLVPYLPTGETSIPTVKSETDATFTIKVDVSPPVVVDGSGATYDPSGSSKDGIWDVGL